MVIIPASVMYNSPDRESDKLSIVNKLQPKIAAQAMQPTKASRGQGSCCNLLAVLQLLRIQVEVGWKGPHQTSPGV